MASKPQKHAPPISHRRPSTGAAMPSRVAVPRSGGREEAPPGQELTSLEQQQQQQQQQTRRRKGSLRKAAMFGRGAAQRDQQPQSPLQHSQVASKTVPSSAVSAATAAASSSSSHTSHTSHTSPPTASTTSTTNSIPPPGPVPDDHASSSGASGLGISVLETATPRASIDDYASRAASAAAAAALLSPTPKSAKSATKFFTSPRSSTDGNEDASVASSVSPGATATAAVTSGASVSARRHDRKRSNSGSITSSPLVGRATASLAITEEETTHPSKHGRAPTSPTSPGLNSSSSTGAGLKSAATAAAVAATTSLRASIGSESHGLDHAGISTSPGATASSPGRILFSGSLASSGAVSHQRRRGNSYSGAVQQPVPPLTASAATTTGAQMAQKPTPRRLSQSAQQPPLQTQALPQSKAATARIPERVAEQPERTVSIAPRQYQPALRPTSQMSQLSQSSQSSQSQARQQIHSLLQDHHRHYMQPPLPPKQRAKSPLALSDLATPLASSSSSAAAAAAGVSLNAGVGVSVGVGGVNVVAVGDPDWDYAETAWWGWVMLIVTWVVFVTGMGSCLGVWSWAWDVGKTPYAPPELEDDPTLPIVGYYPALLILTCVMAWVWVVVAWIGMKYFKHAKISGD